MTRSLLHHRNTGSISVPLPPVSAGEKWEQTRWGDGVQGHSLLPMDIEPKGEAQIFKEKAEADNVEGGPRFYWASPFLYLGILAFGLDD